MSNLIIDSASEQAVTYKHLATAFAERYGVECFPVTGKKPTPNPETGIEYQWRQNALGQPGVHDTPLWGDATGYAVAPCEGSHLVILDIDDHNHPTIQRLISELGLQFTFTVQRGNHRHYYIKASYPLPKAWLTIKQLDLQTEKYREIASLRGYRAYVVGPGSEHPSGDTYERVGQWGIATLSEPQTKLLFEAFQVDWRQARDLGVTTLANVRAMHEGLTVNPDLINEIIRRLEAREGKPLRFSQSGTASLYQNPMRGDDDNRSAFFNRHTGYIHDAATKEYWSCVQVCNYLNIRMRQFGGLSSDKPPQPKQLPAPAATQPTAPYESDLPARRLNFWRDGIPNLVRELLLNLDNETGLADQAPALLTWEVWNHAVRKSLINPTEPFAAARLVGLATDLGWDTSRHTIEKGLAQLCGWGILRRFRDDQSDMGGAKDNNDVPKTQQNSTGPGRKPNLYRFRKLKVALISIVEKVRLRIREWCLSAVPDEPVPLWFAIAGQFKVDIVAEYDRQKMQSIEQTARARALAKYERLAGAKAEALRLENLLQAVSTPLLSDRTYENTIQYRDNLYASKVAANPNRQISRVNAAKEVGRTSDTISAMGRRAGVERVPVYRYVELFPGNNLDDQILKAYRYAFRNAGVAMLATGPDGDTSASTLGCPLDNPQYKMWAERIFTQGYRIFLRIQEASREIPTAPQKVESRRAGPGSSTKKHTDSGQVVVWRGYNPDYVKKQLAMRGLAETPDGRGLRDLETGEVFSPDEP